MILKALSAIWTTVAPSLANHLWQSTLFACVIALLVLVLSKNRAEIRYWLWLAASLKFLVPFSLLAGIGRHLTSSHGSISPRTELYFVMERVGQPFTGQAIGDIPRAAPVSLFQSMLHLLPALLVLWFCGFAVVLFVWCARWRRISAAVQQATRLHHGRELEALRRMDSVVGMSKPIEIRSSRTNCFTYAVATI
jgi:bla regulator protein blaR1